MPESLTVHKAEILTLSIAPMRRYRPRPGVPLAPPRRGKERGRDKEASREKVSVERAHLPAGSVGDTDDVKSHSASRGTSVHRWTSTTARVSDYSEVDNSLIIISGSPVVPRRLDNDPTGQP